jgi:hypothetical protein
VTAPGRYCAPNRCYCGEPDCPAYASYGRPLEPVLSTILDERAIASGRRRSSLGRFREAQAALGKRDEP